MIPAGGEANPASSLQGAGPLLKGRIGSPPSNLVAELCLPPPRGGSPAQTDRSVAGGTGACLMRSRATSANGSGGPGAASGGRSASSGLRGDGSSRGGQAAYGGGGLLGINVALGGGQSGGGGPAAPSKPPAETPASSNLGEGDSQEMDDLLMAAYRRWACMHRCAGNQH